MTRKTYTFVYALLLVTALCTGANSAEPLYPNSVASNNLDFILTSDPNAFQSLSYLTFQQKEMPGNLSGGGLFANAYVFRAGYSNTSPVEIWAHQSFGSVAEARPYVQLLADAVGKLPAFEREELDHVVVHTGNHTSFAEEKAGFFVTYSQNIDLRVSNHDLEETVFHESTHVALQTNHAKSPGWIQAQQNDASFITEYAEENPATEDQPESALFAYAMINYPGRLPASVETAVNNLIPNRIEYLRQIPGFVSGPQGDFDGDDDVDGEDLLAWQRGRAAGGMTSANLQRWRVDYGASIAATSAVPEPSAGLLALACGLALATVRKRCLSSGSA